MEVLLSMGPTPSSLIRGFKCASLTALLYSSVQYDDCLREVLQPHDQTLRVAPNESPEQLVILFTVRLSAMLLE